MKTATEYNRTFDAARKAQGFKSQAHLDAFMRYFDHTQDCPECQKPGRGILLDDGFQPTMNRCAVALDLQRISDALSDAGG